MLDFTLFFLRCIPSWYHKMINNILQLARHVNKKARNRKILAILKHIQTLYGFQKADVKGLELEIDFLKF